MKKNMCRTHASKRLGRIPSGIWVGMTELQQQAASCRSIGDHGPVQERIYMCISKLDVNHVIQGVELDIHVAVVCLSGGDLYVNGCNMRWWMNAHGSTYILSYRA